MLSFVFLGAGGARPVETPTPAATPSSEASSLSLRLELPVQAVVEGGVFFVTLVSPVKLDEARGEFQESRFKFYPLTVSSEPPEHRYAALVGVSFGTAPGKVELVVHAQNGAVKLDTRASVAVVAGTFPSEALTVPQKTVQPRKKDLPKINADRIFLGQVYTNSISEPLWDPPVLLPVKIRSANPVSSTYGSGRVYNGVKQNVHLGTDFRAAMRTAIHAPITGRVVAARFLFYTGYTVILDHGYGLFTIYGHLSKLRVKEGRMAKKGQLLGLSGATGRASGPHLHWGVNLHGVKVDPMILKEVLR